ncbi:MAG: hypothetical protein LUQ11_10775 [Methylococcaceae bacterium]|nr:hypothetical protein [Methylococcaceae bacterium]
MFIDYIGTEKELIAEAATLLGKTLDDVEAGCIHKDYILSQLRTLDALICLIGMSDDERQLARDCCKAALQ